MRRTTDVPLIPKSACDCNFIRCQRGEFFEHIFIELGSHNCDVSLLDAYENFDETQFGFRIYALSHWEYTAYCFPKGVRLDFLGDSLLLSEGYQSAILPELEIGPLLVQQGIS